tara:strand:- start:1703 stop:1906 length:204 start_codon:yes stop_codon:yes gene_type:complete
MINSLFHKIVRWGLGIHGIVHILETFLNIYEEAYMSACFSLFAAFFMIAGAAIDSNHHKQEKEEKRE